MKKIICGILVTAFALCLFSCGQSTENSESKTELIYSPIKAVMLAADVEMPDGSTIKYDIDKDVNREIEPEYHESEQEKMFVRKDGEKILLKFKDTFWTKGLMYRLDTYNDEEGGEYTFDNKTDLFLGYASPYEKYLKELECPDGNYEKMIYKLAEMYFSLEGYEVSEKIEEENDGLPYIEYIFTKKISGIDVDEGMRVLIRKDCKRCFVDCRNNGMFDGSEKVPYPDIDKAKEIVYNKVLELNEGKNTATHIFNKDSIVTGGYYYDKLDDGTVVLMYGVGYVYDIIDPESGEKLSEDRRQMRFAFTFE